MDEEADDRATHKDADGAYIVPDVAAHARTDDHAGALGQLRTDATTFTCPDAATYSYAFSPCRRPRRRPQLYLLQYRRRNRPLHL